MRSIILSAVTCLVLSYFSTLSHKRQDFRKIFFEYDMCLGFSVQRLSETFLILRRTQRDSVANVNRSTCNVSCQIKKKLEFSRQIFEKHSNVNFTKIRLFGAELSHADRQTAKHDEANSRFIKSCERA
jgi:hypothetical protein